MAKSFSGWDIGVRKVRLTEDFYSYGLFDDQEEEEIPPTLSIIECHQDEVLITMTLVLKINTRIPLCKRYDFNIFFLYTYLYI